MPSFASVKSVASATNPPAFVKYYPLRSSPTDPTALDWTTKPASLKFISRKGFITRRNDPITNMSNMFRGITTLNDPDISTWDTSSVTDMREMFYNATAFNQDLTSWDVSSVTSNSDFSLGASSSWTQRPYRSLNFNIQTPYRETTGQTIIQTNNIQMFTVSEIGNVYLSSTSSVSVTGGSFLQPLIIQNDKTMTFIGKNNASSGSVNYYISPGSGADQQFFSYLAPQGNYPNPNFWTGDLLPYIWFPNGTGGFAANAYYITVITTTTAYNQVYSPPSTPFQSGSYKWVQQTTEVEPHILVYL